MTNVMPTKLFKFSLIQKPEKLCDAGAARYILQLSKICNYRCIVDKVTNFLPVAMYVQ